jgi:hypothetical protein
VSRGISVTAKIFEATGIAAVMVGLVQGLYGDMWGELYLFLGGIAIFLTGRRLEKKPAKETGNTETMG